MTCEQSMALRLASIFSSEASPAEEQAPPARERAWEIQRLRSGGRWPESSATYDPDSCSWRTSLLSLLSNEETPLERFSGTWPRSGMWALGTVFPLPPLAPRTSAIGSSSLLPTPLARTNGGTEVSGNSRTGGPMLAEVLLPTPVSGDAKQSRNKTANDGAGSPGHSGTTLTDFAYERSGATTPEPSPDGKKSPAPLLNPCFVAWMQGMPDEWSDPSSPRTAMEFTSGPRCSWAIAFANSPRNGGRVRERRPKHMKAPRKIRTGDRVREKSNELRRGEVIHVNRDGSLRILFEQGGSPDYPPGAGCSSTGEVDTLAPWNVSLIPTPQEGEKR